MQLYLLYSVQLFQFLLNDFCLQILNIDFEIKFLDFENVLAGLHRPAFGTPS